jgi:hypothetical protein
MASRPAPSVQPSLVVEWLMTGGLRPVGGQFPKIGCVLQVDVDSTCSHAAEG